MRRYLRVWALFWSTAIAAEMEYRLNFLFASVAAVFNLVGGLFWIGLFYGNGLDLGGWTWNEALLVLAMFFALNGLSACVMSPNLNRIAEHVHRGTMDFVLLKPIDAQFWLSLRTFSPWGLPDVITAIGLVVYVGLQGEIVWLGLLPAIPTFVASLLVLYGLWFVLASMSFWFIRIDNATALLSGLLEAGRFPITAYPGWWRTFFTVVVPVAFLTTAPAELMIGRGSTLAAFAILPAAGGLLISRMFWNFARRRYTSASS